MGGWEGIGRLGRVRAKKVGRGQRLQGTTRMHLTLPIPIFF